MRIRTTTVLAMALFMISAACNTNRSEQRMPAGSAKNTLASVVNAATIEDPPEAVFDLVTTARDSGRSGTRRRPL